MAIPASTRTGHDGGWEQLNKRDLEIGNQGLVEFSVFLLAIAITFGE